MPDSRRPRARRAIVRQSRQRALARPPARQRVARASTAARIAASPCNSSSASSERRRAVGQVDVGPDRACWRRRRADRVAEARPAQRASRRSAVPRARTPPAAWATSTLASTCGRCETQAIRRSWALGVDRLRAARRDARSGSAGARTAPGSLTSARREVPDRALEQILARAARRPAVSAPASGWPPTKRRSRRASLERALGGADVADHAVRAGAGERLATRPRASAPTGAATNTTSASARRAPMSGAARSIAPSPSAVAHAAGSGS